MKGNLTETRRNALLQARSDDGLHWQPGNRSLSTVCNWLYKAGYVTWGHINCKQVLIATPAGRSALAEGGERDG